MLAPYAVNDENSRGRQHPVELAKDRNQFQRDYTRILHCQAFRRLQHKTQVFSSNMGDMFRTRMSHSLEVEQIARSIARQLHINEDLCGVLALGHDIGHAPFGHMGQDTINDLMAEYGGFEHNLQALRLVDTIESPYPSHRGLNLMFETREGLLKHCARVDADAIGDVGRRHLEGTSPTLEAQVVDLADAIAYCHADLEDAFMMGLLDIKALREAPGYEQAWTRIRGKMPVTDHPTDKNVQEGDAEDLRLAHAVVKSVIRDMMAVAIEDLIRTTRRNLEVEAPQSPDDVRRLKPLAEFSDDQRTQHYALKRYSRARIYEHEAITSVRIYEKKVLESLFRAYEKSPEEMGGKGVPKGKDFYRHLADHVSGMTDRYTMSEYERLCEQRPDLMDVKSPARRRPA